MLLGALSKELYLPEFSSPSAELVSKFDIIVAAVALLTGRYRLPPTTGRTAPLGPTASRVCDAPGYGGQAVLPEHSFMGDFMPHVSVRSTPPWLVSALLSAVVLVTLMLVPLVAAQSPVGPDVAVLSPGDGGATNADALNVEVAFRADANSTDGASGPTGNITLVVLLLDGVEAARRYNPADVEEGTHAFTVNRSRLPEGTHTLQALAYQGNERAGLSGESAPVEVLIDRTSPVVEIASPADGVYVIDPALTVEGSAEDVLSGLAGVTCGGATATTTGDAFACDVLLVEGPNDVLVRARDVAGNVASASLRVHYVPGGIPGAPDAPAVGALFDSDDSSGIRPEDVSVDDAGVKVARTQIEIGFAKDATVAEVNELLVSVGGRIVSMLSGVMVTAARIPDPGSLAGLEAVIAEVEASPIVRFVNGGYFGAPDVLPGNIPPEPSVLIAVRHHLAVHAHGAWNARRTLSNPSSERPDILIADYFGAGWPGGYPENPIAGTFATGHLHEHGYHFVGIVGALHGGADNGRGYVTGMHPNGFGLRGLDLVADGSTVPPTYLTSAVRTT